MCLSGEWQGQQHSEGAQHLVSRGQAKRCSAVVEGPFHWKQDPEDTLLGKEVVARLDAGEPEVQDLDSSDAGAPFAALAGGHAVAAVEVPSRLDSLQP